ncbi:transposase [Geodermatophilus sp. CPCC 205761]|uniref:transposase n=1 Tax=Geodermatophilus sp. CPCC 205761 TaxID=2936597 RepID=UPI003F52A7A0
MVQTCIVHLVRASVRWVNDNDRKKVAALLRTICSAPTEAAARARGLGTSSIATHCPSRVAVLAGRVAAPRCSDLRKRGSASYRRRLRAITIRWIWLVPS